MASKLTLSVSQLNEYVRSVLQMDPVLHNIDLKGEISNVKFHQNGMLYFTLKDEHAAISCVMYPDDVDQLQAEPFDGMKVVLSGSVSLYARGGQYQFAAKSLRAQGLGTLFERFLALKNKLELEGLFDREKKKRIPSFVDTVGVVSSPTGAVIHDILNVSLRRNPQARVLLCPVRVQGVGAADEVEEAIGLLEKLDHVSVIIVARGGGSMEDLWTFNEETVVRAVAGCKKPIVSAVGHETDVTLCDLAADLRVPTPSAAAECVMPIRSELENQLLEYKHILSDQAYSVLLENEHELKLKKMQLSSLQPARRLEAEEKRFEKNTELFRHLAKETFAKHVSTLKERKKALELLSPYRVLARGYAIVQREGKAVASSKLLHAGEGVTLKFADGCVQAEVTDREEET